MERREFSLEEEMELMAQELQRHFSHSELNKLAREVGFVKRRSKFTAKDLIERIPRSFRSGAAKLCKA